MSLSIDQINELQAENERLGQIAEIYEERWAQAHAQAQRHRTALHRYASHDGACRGQSICSCGLDAALAAPARKGDADV